MKQDRSHFVPILIYSLPSIKIFKCKRTNVNSLSNYPAEGIVVQPRGGEIQLSGNEQR